jgi:hypothetical protein
LDNDLFAIEFIQLGADEIVCRENTVSISIYKLIQIAIERKRKLKEQTDSNNYLINSIIDGATESIFVKDIDRNTTSFSITTGCFEPGLYILLFSSNGFMVGIEKITILK